MNADRLLASYDHSREMPEALGGRLGRVFDLSVHSKSEGRNPMAKPTLESREWIVEE